MCLWYVFWWGSYPVSVWTGLNASMKLLEARKLAHLQDVLSLCDRPSHLRNHFETLHNPNPPSISKPVDVLRAILDLIRAYGMEGKKISNNHTNCVHYNCGNTRLSRHMAFIQINFLLISTEQKVQANTGADSIGAVDSWRGGGGSENGRCPAKVHSGKR